MRLKIIAKLFLLALTMIFKKLWPLFVIIFVIVYLIISFPSNTYKPIPSTKLNISNTQTEFRNKDDEAVEIVKRCKIPELNGNVLELTAGYLETAKSIGNFIEFEGWAGFQVSGSLYEVVVAWKVNGEKKKARWDVDFAAKTIKSKNQEAFIFLGKNDLMMFP